jgi:hypothetical protein
MARVREGRTSGRRIDAGGVRVYGEVLGNSHGERRERDECALTHGETGGTGERADRRGSGKEMLDEIND